MKIQALLLLLAIPLAMKAQHYIDAPTRHDIQLIQSYYQQKAKSPVTETDLFRRFALNKINGQSYLSVLVRKTKSFKSEFCKQQGILTGSEIGNIQVWRVPATNLSALFVLEGIDQLELAQKIHPDLDQAIKDVHADSVHKGINLPQAYTGKNVFIGICDWGFDYSHPTFYDTLLQQTRIEAAWDQYKNSGPSPAGFNYGTEYSTQAELLAAGSDTANIYSYGLHGTHVGGICGGSGGGSPYRGVAFEARYLMATFLIDAAAVLDAYAWMYQKAEAAGKRLVINQSWGLHHIGNLDGTSLLSQTIDHYSGLGVVFVTSGGNNGSWNFHIKKTFTADTIATRVAFYDYTFPTMWGQSITAWGEPGKAFSTGFEVINSSGVKVGQTAMFASNTTLDYVDTLLVIGADTIWYNLSAENANPQNARPHIRFRIKNNHSNLRVILKATATDGTVHFWNVVELINDVGNWGQAFAKNNSSMIAGDNNYGIGEPACTGSTIAVAAYSTGAGIASFSSYGPTLDERVKPDIAGPGVNIASAVSSFTDDDFTQIASVNFNGKDYPFARLSGTSMSGPMVTGIVALLLEANPYLSIYQIKNILQQTARQDSFTGTISAPGSLRWGAGKVNAYAAIQLALQTIGDVGIYEQTSESWMVYPNPAQGYLQLDLEQVPEIMEVTLLAADGKRISLTAHYGYVALENLPAGLYLLHVQHQGRVYQQNIVKL